MKIANKKYFGLPFFLLFISSLCFSDVESCRKEAESFVDTSRNDDPAYIEAVKERIIDCAKLGDEDYRLFLFLAYANGAPDFDIKQDWNQSLKWVELSAQEGSAEHQSILVNYYTTENVVKGLVDTEESARFKAYKWYYASLTSNYSNKWHKRIKDIESKMSKEQIALAIAEGETLYPQNFERDGPEAYGFLGVKYFNGEYVEKNLEKAHGYFLKAANLGYSYSQNALGNHYTQGIGHVDIDVEEGLRWYEKSAVQGNGYALFNLAKIYLEGKLVSQDVPQGLEYLEAAAGKSVADAQVMLGEFYVNGTYVSKDTVRAFTLFTSASRGQNSYASYYLGQCYSYGVGTEVDKREAYKWYLKSAKAGNLDAQYSMGVANENGVIEASIYKNLPDAISWYQKATDQGHGKAQFNLGMVYFRGGEGIEKNLYKAYENIYMARVEYKYKENLLPDIMKQMSLPELEKLNMFLESKK